MTSLLHYRTWRTLRAVTLAHGLFFDSHLPKSENKLKLSAALMSGKLQRAYRTLIASEREPLIALQASGAHGTRPV